MNRRCRLPRHWHFYNASGEYCRPGDPTLLAREIERRLSDRTLPAERDLVGTWNASSASWRVSMSRSARRSSVASISCARACLASNSAQASRGLARSTDLDDYCYYVAVSSAKCSPICFAIIRRKIARHRSALYAISASFAQGLQMTNILKDVWKIAAAAPAGCRRRSSPVMASISLKCRANPLIRALAPPFAN